MYADNDVYIFRRGNVMICLTNKANGLQKKTITRHPYRTGQVICSIMYPDSDCITVTSKGFDVYLKDGEFKIYVPK